MINLFAEGIYVDMWTVPHFLFGLILFIFLVDRRVKISLAITITIFLAVFWEFFETASKIQEYNTNRIVDVLVTVMGFCLLYILNKKTHFMSKIETKDTLWRYSLGVWILVNALGWMSYVFL